MIIIHILENYEIIVIIREGQVYQYPDIISRQKKKT